MARPGRYGTPLKTRRGTSGHIDPNLEAFGTIGHNTFHLYLFPEGYTEEGSDGPQLVTDEMGPTVRFVVVRKLQIDLTDMTHEELSALRDFINRAIDIAEPVVLARDKEAQDAYEAGHDTLSRLHRAVPSVVVRSRAQRAHSEILRIGSPAVLAGGWRLLNQLIGAGGSRGKVVDSQSQDAEPQDDRKASD